ncbi:PLP-dependent aminotransferase family protein [Brevibacillus fluminis]|uniref:PLP-dependent aminotransferase family protein n=1 Tax=Brevibacillus fluminis TaxID=511487 RepID=A0A3M8DI55_9BACL|nr:PLP-dependent aminotransferase family protein [Brevibacillus fluminis]RNB87782.1 PLP-dependent aminotransferase family protein [Brevibacillus fluminis]
MGRKPIYQEVYNQLRYQILSGEWTIGSMLPPERKLSSQLGVSRNTVVKAFDELQAEGFIESRMGSGRYVEPLPPERSLGRINWQEVSQLSALQTTPCNMAEMLNKPVLSPELINFAHGDGGKHTWNFSQFAEYVKRAAEKPHSYYFHTISGYLPLREWIVKQMGVSQIHSPDQVMITSGSQEALFFIATLLAKPGDTIATEMPTYFGSLQLFQSLGLRIIPLPMDKDGMKVDVLEGVLARYRPKFVYTVPTFHNPTGVTLSLARRKRLVALSEQYRIPIIEDDAYRHLHMGKEPPPPLKSFDDSGNIIYVNTFSKILFPGLRIGWIAASRPFIQMCSRMKELSITTNTLGQIAIADFLMEQNIEKHLAKVRTIYRTQSQAMQKHLVRMKPLGVHFEPTSGGFYYWVSLPEGMNARELMQRCHQRGLSIVSGDMFLLREAIQPYVRLCYSHETEEEIARGMEIMDELLREGKEREV